jgi:hypothetical protein
MPKNTIKTTKIAKEPKTFYIVMSQEMEYNDQNYFPAGDGQCGNPEKMFDNHEDAEKACEQMNAEQLNGINPLDYCEWIYDLVPKQNEEQFKKLYKEFFGKETVLFDKDDYDHEVTFFPRNATLEQIIELAKLMNLQFYYVAKVSM